MTELKDKPEIKIEILRAENIKPEIRNEHNLPEFGIVIKRSIRTSPSIDEYESISNPFLTRVNANLDKMSGNLLKKLDNLR